MTRSVDSGRGRDYLAKAENSLRMARIAVREQAYDNAVMSAVHSAINALDALAVSYLGRRASGLHTDVLALVKGSFSTAEYQEMRRQFTSLLSMKNASEYQPDPMDKVDAENSVKWAERIVGKVKEKLKDLEK
ncbi:MAG: HEPN domain-containing protein [Nitrososphaera sp.]